MYRLVKFKNSERYYNMGEEEKFKYDTAQLEIGLEGKKLGYYKLKKDEVFNCLNMNF